ncbi:MAG: MFS transporter [Actinomycetota bacterium]
MEEVHRPPPPRPGLRHSLSLLGRNPAFARLYAATLVSFVGDWFAIIAVLGRVNDLTNGSAPLVTLVMVTQMVSIAIFSPLGGSLADRFDRRRLMVVADLVRVVLALGYLLMDTPGEVWMAYVITAGIGAFTAAFEPTTNAAVPNLVDPEDLPAANVLMGSAWGTMLAVGGALGGIVAATLGRDAAFVGDALSFAVSALLIVGIRRRFSEERTGEHPTIRAAVRDTVRYARLDRRVFALLSVKAGFGLSGGIMALLPLVSLNVFRTGDRGTGILLAARGIGALLGPFLARRFTQNLRSLYAAIGVSFAVYGISYGIVSLSPALWFAAVFVVSAHLGGGAQWTLSTYGLQRIVPDSIRGRVFSFDFGLATLSFSVSILLGGWVADQWGALAAIGVLAAISGAWAIVWTVLTSRIRRESTFERQPELAEV